MASLEQIQEDFQIEVLPLYCGVGADHLAWCYPRHWGEYPQFELGYYLGYGATPIAAKAMAQDALLQVMGCDLTPWHSPVNVAAYMWTWHIINNDPVCVPEIPVEVDRPHWLEEKLEEDGIDPKIREFAKLLKANLRLAIALKSFDVRQDPPDIILQSEFQPLGLAAVSDPFGLLHPWHRVIWVNQDCVSGQLRYDDYKEYWTLS